MTHNLKGPPEGTPALASGSTDKEVAAALADECVEQLSRLADEAENFKVSSYKWKVCCERIEEWVRKAADAEKKYGEKLRALLRDKSAMEGRAGKDWEYFDYQKDRLLRAIWKIYHSAGDSHILVVRAIPGPGIDPFDHGLALERYIQNQMHRHGVAISRARNAALKGFYAWWAEERKRRADAESESKTPAQRHHGPEVNFDRYKVIADTARRNEPYRKPENEKKIKEHLDCVQLAPPRPRDKSEAPAMTWAEISRNRYLDAVRYAYKQVPRE